MVENKESRSLESQQLMASVDEKKDRLVRYWNTDSNWKLQTVYVCKRDPRTFVPARVKVGDGVREPLAWMPSPRKYTPNLAHLRTWMTLLSVVLAFVFMVSTNLKKPRKMPMDHSNDL